MSPGVQLDVLAPSDVPSLSTIFARAFHTRNAYLKAAIPDTEQTRAWWRGTYERALDSRSETVLVVRHTGQAGTSGSAPVIVNGASQSTADAREAGQASMAVVGMIRLERFKPGDSGIGFWTDEWSTDHDHARCSDFIGLYAQQRERLMGDREHIGEVSARDPARTEQRHLWPISRDAHVVPVITLLGTDASFSGRGIGPALVLAAKRMASGFKATSAAATPQAGSDEAPGEKTEPEVPLLVMTGPTGRGFYEKYGFKCVHEVKMQGDVDYSEYVLVWEPGAGV